MNYYNDKLLFLISQEILDVDTEKLKSIYNSFQKGETLKIKTEEIGANYRKFLIQEGVKHRQFDLPYFFDNKKEKTIMIIGMDPKSTNPDDEHVLLNTPYSLQTEAGQKTNANDYGDIISSLSKEFNIYLTDIYKAYFLKGILVSSENLEYITFKNNNGSFSNFHESILMKEIDEVKPQGILCWGRPSRNLTAKILKIKLKASISLDNNYPYFAASPYEKLKLVATPHPSGLTRDKHWASFYEKNIPAKKYSKDNRPKDLSEMILDKLI
jgi:hypothetical protein